MLTSSSWEDLGCIPLKGAGYVNNSGTSSCELALPYQYRAVVSVTYVYAGQTYPLLFTKYAANTIYCMPTTLLVL